MLTVDEAFEQILAVVSPGPVVETSLIEALGRALAEPLFATADSPPFDKSLMDGFAIRAIESGDGPLAVIEEVMAGQVPQQTLGAHQATRVMTGAPIPPGADAVVPIEKVEYDAAAQVVQPRVAVEPGQNVLRRGDSFRSGDRVLPAGRLLRAQELGAIAELGAARVRIRKPPRVGILATGDELVEVDQTPGPGQIRNSNETMLAAQVRLAGGEPICLGIARDTRESLREKILPGLECDLLLLSGGVSAGVLDLVPDALAALGVREVFHKVRLKPGQPLWFGVSGETGLKTTNSPRDAAHTCAVFGLPGNPVSSMVCCELFVRAAIRRRLGIVPERATPLRARLAHHFTHKGDRPTYHPARLDWTPDGPAVTAVKWIGSADLSATVAANAMAVFLPGETRYSPGTLVDVYPW